MLDIDRNGTDPNAPAYFAYTCGECSHAQKLQSQIVGEDYRMCRESPPASQVINAEGASFSFYPTVKGDFPACSRFKKPILTQ